jgi:hypothetical protein
LKADHAYEGAVVGDPEQPWSKRFVTESQKIAALYGDLAKQSYKPFGGFVAKMTPTVR